MSISSVLQPILRIILCSLLFFSNTLTLSFLPPQYPASVSVNLPAIDSIYHRSMANSVEQWTWGKTTALPTSCSKRTAAMSLRLVCVCVQRERLGLSVWGSRAQFFLQRQRFCKSTKYLPIMSSTPTIVWCNFPHKNISSYSNNFKYSALCMMAGVICQCLL